MDAEKIRTWINDSKSKGYAYDIPDEAPDIFEREGMVPSYRRVCLAIMKNDCQLQSLGFNREQCHIYNIIKRNELKQRGKIKHIQMRLFDECI